MIRIGSMCSGYGGLDLAVEAVLGPARLAWVADPDPGATAILAHHWPEVPNLGDITAVNWAEVEPVDVLTAGFPCQPVSVAGRRDGIEDERWLFDDIRTAIGRMGARPRMLVLENVPGLLTANRGHAMARVVHGLAALGYVGSWRVVAAADVGAPHRRARIFIVGRLAAENADLEPRPERWLTAPDQAESGRSWAEPGQRSGTPVADAYDLGLARSRATRDGRSRPTDGRRAPADTPGDGRHEGRTAATRVARRPHAAERGLTPPDTARLAGQGRAEYQRGADAHPDSGTASHAPGDGHGHTGPTRERGIPAAAVSGGPTDVQWGPYEPAITRWAHVTGRPAPPPTESNRTGRPVLSPRFVEWMMGLPPGWVTDVPGLSRAAQLRALGNGVVPAQAATALVDLLADWST